MPQGIYRQLRTLGKVQERITRYHTGTQHPLKAVLDDYFPELKEIFWSVSAKGLWGVLEECPFPEDVIKKTEEEIVRIIARQSRRDQTSWEKARQVCQAARQSIRKDSGFKAGRRWISKKGRYLLQKFLYFMALRYVVVLDNFNNKGGDN